MSSTSVLNILCLIVLIVWCNAAQKPFSCMSYLEDDKSLGDVENDDDFDEYPSASSTSASSLTDAAAMLHVGNLVVAERSTDMVGIAAPHRRVCPSDYTFCFSLWRQTENATHIEKQGCWKESTERNATCNQRECTSSSPTSRNSSLFYCCCSGDACNQHVAVVEPSSLQLSKEVLQADEAPAQDSERLLIGNTFLWCTFFVFSTLISIAAAFIYRHSGKDQPEPEESPLSPSGPGYSSNLRNVDNINLVCILGYGKYGTVMKGLLQHEQEVAVKIYPETHHQYYINERNIYSLPLMESPSLLTYFGYDERQTMDGKVEYQLVLSLAPLGCLQDWLIANAMDFETFCGMAKSITRGISHLHTELRCGDAIKPCIAHRDINSRNVLVRADLTCCIADFGFALKVFGSKYEYKGEVAMAETKSINEVGTLRYMAPELLEGAVNLRDCETSLKQMDVYALGLVLWEVATRCEDFYPPAQHTPPPYKAPYELEVGAHPSFDQMQSLVVRHKARPLFPAGWGGGAASKLVRDTCEDCWDHDAEARLTSLCAEERMQEVAGFHPNAHAANPLLSANNLTNAHAVISNVHHINEVKTCGLDTTTLLQPPPNQKVLPRIADNELTTEKNHLMHPQQQLQPYQGRNPCLERNLAPAVTRPLQVLVEKSKKHSFQVGEENSFSCLEDDVSVEDLLAGGMSKKMSAFPNDSASMGQGFPKQHNTDKKLRGWHGVRALIQKKLFRRDEANEVFRQLENGDEKSNLVENHYTAIMKANQKHNNAANGFGMITINDSASIESTNLHNRRPNNLDLNPSTSCCIQMNKSNLIHSIAEEFNGENISLQQATMAVPRSSSSSLIKHNKTNRKNNNNNNNNNNIDTCCKPEQSVTTSNSCSSVEANYLSDHQLLRRQRSLEVFREVFSGRGSSDKLRDPSQRVKTPGDVPPSVRKVRASKTLSLYDDRMMDSSTLNIL